MNQCTQHKLCYWCLVKVKLQMNKGIEAHFGFLDSEGEEILRRKYPIHKACQDGDVLKLLNLIAGATFGDLLVEDQFHGWMPIHWSSYFGKVSH